ncbi:TPA: hypothetical protein QCY66_004766 [Bacillus cereus]|nr:hypothetical protein [Bacillus cereus]
MKIEIDEKLKERVYQYAGFGFSNNLLLDQELNYNNVFKAIDLGPEFNRICKDLELDTDIVAEYIKKYTLHLIIQDVKTLKYPNIRALMKIKNEEIKNQKIEAILNEIFFKTPKDLFNTLSYIEGYFTPKQIEDKLYKEYEYEDWNETTLTTESKRKWRENSKKTGSFYQLYVKYATRKSRVAQSLVKHFDKITNYDQELLNKQIHFKRFKKALALAEFDPSQDFWLFEYNTYLLMLQKISSYKELQDLDEKYFPVLASFLIVGDIRLKLLLVETFFNTFSWSHFKNKLSNLVLLSVVIIPFFKEYTKNKLMALITESMLTPERKLIDYDSNDIKLIDITKQLYVYQILKTENCYNGESLASEFRIDVKSEIPVTEGLKKVWKHIGKVRETIDKKYSGLLEDLLYHIEDFEFPQYPYEAEQEELSRTFREWIRVGVFEATKEYKDSIIRSNIDHNANTSESILKMYSGKIDEEKRNLQLSSYAQWQKRQKELDEIIGEELDQLGIDVDQLKEISEKYNCSIIIEPKNITNKILK